MDTAMFNSHAVELTQLYDRYINNDLGDRHPLDVMASAHGGDVWSLDDTPIWTVVYDDIVMHVTDEALTVFNINTEEVLLAINLGEQQ